MTNEEILDKINSLPPDAQLLIEDFIRFLQERYKNTNAITALVSDLETEKFVGMWSDCEDMDDSTAWVRNVRKKHWSK